MENASKVQQWYHPVTALPRNIRPVLLAGGLGLVVILSGLAALNPLIGVACALLLLLLVVILPRPILIVYGLVFIQPLVGGMARGVGIPFLRLGQALLIIGFILFMLAKPAPQGKSRLTAIDLAFGFYFLTESILPLLAILYRGDHLDLNTPSAFTGITGLQSLLGPLQYYVLYRIVVATISSEKQIRMVLNLSFIASIIVSVIGILQKLGIGPVRAILATYYPSISLGYTVSNLDLRITSTLGSYAGLAAYLCFTMIVALTCYVDSKRLKISPLLLAATLLFDSIALILTGTFTASIGLAIGAVIIFILLRRLPKLVIFVLLGIALAAIIFQPFISDRLNEWLGGGTSLLPTYAQRIRLWENLFFPAIGQHLWFGSGPAPAVLQSWPSEESQYFALLLTGGVFDLFSYFLLMGIAITICWHQIKRRSEGASRIVAIATLVVLVVINIMNVSAVYFTYVGGTQTIWLLLAIVVASTQFGDLEALNTATPLVDRSWRTIDAPSCYSLGIENSTAVDRPVVENYVTRRKNAVGSYVLIPSSRVPGVSIPDRYRERSSWLERILDWRFVKDSVVVGVGATVARILGLSFAILLAHFLTPANYGFFRYSLALISIITIASTAGPVSLSRFLAANPNDSQARERYFSNGLLGLALLLLFSLLISVPFLWLLHDLDPGVLICIICLAAFYGYFYVVRGLSSAWKMGLTYALSNIALMVALLVVLGLFRIRTTSVALAIYGLTDLVPILVLELVRPMALRFRPRLISKAVLLELARFAMPLVTAAGVYIIWFNIDVLFIGNFNPSVSGSYAAAKTLALAFIFVPSAITMVLMPKVAPLGLDKGKRYLAGAVLISFLLCLAGIVFTDLWGHRVIALTFGARYSDAYLPLLVLGIGMSFYSVYIILEGFIIGRGRPSLAVKAMLVALVSTSAAGFWLTPRLSMLGASLSFTIGAVLGTAAMIFNTWLFLSKERQLANGVLSSTDLTSGASV